MNLLQLAWSYLRARPLGTLLNVLLLALGVGTIGFVRIVDGQVGDSLNRDAQGIDLVVGAKGSPIQLILAGHLSPRCADRQHSAQVRTGAGEESADPACDPDLARRQLPRLPHRRARHRTTSDSTMGASHRGECGATRCRRCWGQPSPHEHGACRRRSVRRLARLGRRRTSARRFGLYGGRRAEADRHRARPAGPGQHGKRLVRARGQHHRSRGTEGHRGRTAGDGAAGAVRVAAGRGFPAAQDQYRNQHAGRIARLRVGAPVPHDRCGRGRHPGLWRRRIGNRGAVALHRALPRAQRARLRHRGAAHARCPSGQHRR